MITFYFQVGGETSLPFLTFRGESCLYPSLPLSRLSEMWEGQESPLPKAKNLTFRPCHWPFEVRQKRKGVSQRMAKDAPAQSLDQFHDLGMLSVNVYLPSGRCCKVAELSPESRVRELKAAVQERFKRRFLRLAFGGRQLDPWIRTQQGPPLFSGRF